MVEQRQLAERQRVAGNAAMAARNWSEALRCYEIGLESQRHSIVLHANAALAALKKQCYVQALEHCDKVKCWTAWHMLHLKAHGFPCGIMKCCWLLCYPINQGSGKPMFCKSKLTLGLLLMGTAPLCCMMCERTISTTTA